MRGCGDHRFAHEALRLALSIALAAFSNALVAEDDAPNLGDNVTIFFKVAPIREAEDALAAGAFHSQGFLAMFTSSARTSRRSQL